MRDVIILLWNFLDPFYQSCTRLTFPIEKKKDNIFRIRLTKYKGRNVILSDGTNICKNDTLVKIHIHNVKLISELKDINSDFKRASILYKRVKHSLPDVYMYIANHPRREKIKGILGISSLNRGSEHLGFDTFDIHHPLYKRFKQIAFFSISYLSRKNGSIRDLIKQQPKYLMMSKQMLKKKYGT